MDIRKIIREQLESMFAENTSDNVIVGLDIINHFPFNKLPDTINDVDWKSREIPGWGQIHIPALNGNGLTAINSKDAIIGGESWSHPKTNHVLDNHGFISDFKNKYGEEPKFVLNPSAPWFSKIEIINESYLQAKSLYNNIVGKERD